VRISVDSRRLALAGAQTVWPVKRDLKVVRNQGRDEIVISNFGTYVALYLKLA
jgi:hypothetical protein